MNYLSKTETAEKNYLDFNRFQSGANDMHGRRQIVDDTFYVRSLFLFQLSFYFLEFKCLEKILNEIVGRLETYTF